MRSEAPVTSPTSCSWYVYHGNHERLPVSYIILNQQMYTVSKTDKRTLWRMGWRVQRSWDTRRRMTSELLKLRYRKYLNQSPDTNTGPTHFRIQIWAVPDKNRTQPPNSPGRSSPTYIHTVPSHTRYRYFFIRFLLDSTFYLLCLNWKKKLSVIF